MPVSSTKNNKNPEEISLLVKQAFPGETILEITELSDGYFNVAYRITLSGKREMILKIAPPPDSLVMTHEKRIMFTEVEVMGIVAHNTSVPVAKVLYYDDSCSMCDAEFFFMEYLSGNSFATEGKALEQEHKNRFFFQMGKYTSMINTVKNDRFGYYSQPQKQGIHWFSVFRDMIEDTYRDAERLEIPISCPRETLLSCLDRDRPYFEEVTRPSLVHWDIWAGNVFIEDTHITGIIDFERSLWADPLMEVGFRTYQYEKAFFEGYGMPDLNPDQLRRAQWYDIYLFLISCLECDYRQYESRDIYHWGTQMLEKWVREKIR